MLLVGHLMFREVCANTTAVLILWVKRIWVLFGAATIDRFSAAIGYV